MNDRATKRISECLFQGVIQLPVAKQAENYMIFKNNRSAKPRIRAGNLGKPEKQKGVESPDWICLYRVRKESDICSV
jgi:hypothetical protein